MIIKGYTDEGLLLESNMESKKPIVYTRLSRRLKAVIIDMFVLILSIITSIYLVGQAGFESTRAIIWLQTETSRCLIKRVKFIVTYYFHFLAEH